MAAIINSLFTHYLGQSRSKDQWVMVAALLLTLSGCAADRPISHLVDGDRATGTYFDPATGWNHESHPAAAVEEYTKGIEMALDPKVIASLDGYSQYNRLDDLSYGYRSRGNAKWKLLNDPKGAIEDFTEAIKYYGEMGNNDSVKWRTYLYEDRAKCKEQLNDLKGAKEDRQLASNFNVKVEAHDAEELRKEASWVKTPPSKAATNSSKTAGDDCVTFNDMGMYLENRCGMRAKVVANVSGNCPAIMLQEFQMDAGAILKLPYGCNIHGFRAAVVYRIY